MYAYPVKFNLIDVEYGVEAQMIEVDLIDLVKKLCHVLTHSKEAFIKGKKASKYVHEEFSLLRMGQNLKFILKKIQQKIP